MMMPTWNTITVTIIMQQSFLFVSLRVDPLVMVPALEVVFRVREALFATAPGDTMLDEGFVANDDPSG
jgi:hypothetical protein